MRLNFLGGILAVLAVAALIVAYRCDLAHTTLRNVRFRG